MEIKTRLRTRGFADVIKSLRELEIPDRILVTDNDIPELLAIPFEADHIWVINWAQAEQSSTRSLLRRIGFISDQRSS